GLYGHLSGAHTPPRPALSPDGCAPALGLTGPFHHRPVTVYAGAVPVVVLAGLAGAAPPAGRAIGSGCTGSLRRFLYHHRSDQHDAQSHRRGAPQPPPPAALGAIVALLLPAWRHRWLQVNFRADLSPVLLAQNHPRPLAHPRFNAACPHRSHRH